MKKAFVMNVYKGNYKEYKKRHDELWPELKKAILEHGAISYSIFLLEETGQLFSYLELENEHNWDALASTEICQNWWAYMEPLMETNDDNSPVSNDLRCVFNLDKEG